MQETKLGMTDYPSHVAGTENGNAKRAAAPSSCGWAIQRPACISLPPRQGKTTLRNSWFPLCLDEMLTMAPLGVTSGHNSLSVSSLSFNCPGFLSAWCTFQPEHENTASFCARCDGVTLSPCLWLHLEAGTQQHYLEVARLECVLPSWGACTPCPVPVSIPAGEARGKTGDFYTLLHK